MENQPSTQSMPAISWEMLEKSLAHSNVLIRQKAIERAGRFNDVRAVIALQGLVRDENPAIRTSAAQSLVEAARQRNIETDSALAQLITSAADDELRVFLISNVAPNGSETLLRAVIASLVDSAANIREAAEHALRQKGGAWMITDVAAEMLPTIEGARSAFNAEVSAAAARWSAQLQRAQLRRTMLDSGLSAALTLSTALQSASPTMRAAAAEALRRTNSDRAIPALRDALRDRDESVRRTAAVALGSLGWRPASTEELISWQVAIGRWEQAVAHGDAALEAVLFAAQNSGPDTQAKAIECIAQLNSLLAALQLVPALESPHPSVRRATATALKILEWVPPTEEHAIKQAIELDDWAAVAAYGARTIPLLMAGLKASRNQPARHATILDALTSITAPSAFEELVRLCADGDVAAFAVAALQTALERNSSDASDGALMTIVKLKNAVQFKFRMEPAEEQPLRSGIEVIDLAPLRHLAETEIIRRKEAAADVPIFTSAAGKP